MLTELHASLAVNPYRFCNTADRALPHIRRHPAAPGNVHGPRQRDRCGLLRFHRLVVACAADPPGLLLILGPGPTFSSVLLHIPGALLPTGPARGLRLRDLEFFVIASLDGSDLVRALMGRTWSVFTAGGSGSGLISAVLLHVL